MLQLPSRSQNPSPIRRSERFVEASRERAIRCLDIFPQGSDYLPNWSELAIRASGESFGDGYRSKPVFYIRPMSAVRTMS